MSEIYEGAICKSDNPINKERLANLVIEIKPLKDNLQLVFRNDDRNFADFSDTFEAAVRTLSEVCDLVLMFRYDSRIGCRYSALFEAGELKREFTIENEIYVLLAENGEPLTEGEKFSANELLPDEEYETYKNAIELGIENAGFSVDWEDLKEILWAG